jgi:FtsZ-binding cell division protein ZapB
MKFSTVLLFTILAAVLGLYWYSATAAQCPVPLAYRIGEIDESFSISHDEAVARVVVAEALWEDVTDRDLFVYDETAKFTIDFVFDDRQQTINAEASERVVLDEQRTKNQSLVETIEALQQEYEALREQYKMHVATYERELDEYNQRVNQYNDRGGAPADVFAELEDERNRLAAESEALNDTTKELNDFVGRIAELNESANRQIDAYNREVQRYNNRYGYEREFTQGDYQGDSIHIYSFTSDAELEKVLAHEFGHALGIGHVEASSSLMYYLMEDPQAGPRLTEADMDAFIAVCDESETMGQKARHVIRQFIQNF